MRYKKSVHTCPSLNTQINLNQRIHKKPDRIHHTFDSKRLYSGVKAIRFDQNLFIPDNQITMSTVYDDYKLGDFTDTFTRSEMRNYNNTTKVNLSFLLPNCSKSKYLYQQLVITNLLSKYKITEKHKCFFFRANPMNMSGIIFVPANRCLKILHNTNLPRKILLILPCLSINFSLDFIEFDLRVANLNR